MAKEISTLLARTRIDSADGLSAQKRKSSASTYDRLHRHDYTEIELIVSGGGIQVLNGTRYTLSRGSLYILRPSDLHMVSLREQSVYYNISFSEHLADKNIIQSIASFGGDLYTVLGDAELKTAELLSDALIAEARTKPTDDTVLRCILRCLLLKAQKNIPLYTGTAGLREPMRDALAYMQMHFMDNPSLRQTAQVAHYNTSHFSTCFHEQMKQTYSEYLNRLKVNCAKNLLLTTDMSVTSIGYECGFQSESNFLRVFKQYVGTAPSDFRKTSRSR